jgi:hypothetical protein
MIRPALLLATAVAALAVPAAAQAGKVNVPAAFGSKLTSYAKKSGPAIYLPSTIDLDIDASTKVYSEGSAGKRSYDLDLAGAPNCGHATACFLAHFSGERGQPLGFKSNATLVQGIRAHYQPLSCGGSCSPPWIAWKLNGIRYEIQANVSHPSKRYFVTLANIALAHGGRP